MFGLIIGMSVFSMLSLTWARQELLRQQELNAKREHEHAVDMAKAVEFSLLAETHSSYTEDIDLQKAMLYSNTATGKTKGGEQVLVAMRQDSDDTAFGAGSTRIGITASDDVLKRSQVYRAGSAEDILQMSGQKNSGVVSIDTSAIRIKQMRDSMRALEGMAEQVYAFFAGYMRFPSSSEYTQLADKFNYRDAWGKVFDYAFVDNENAELAFTTPWNYTYTQKLSLKDQYEQQE